MWLRSWFGKLFSPFAALWRRLREGRGLSVAELARRLGVDVAQLHGLQPTYQPRRIPKRSGGQRLLSIPSDELKAMQKRVLEEREDSF